MSQNIIEFKSDLERMSKRLREAYDHGFTDNYQCKQDGLMADVSSGCIIFYDCIWTNSVYAQKLKRICPEGTAFNMRYKICDWAHKVIC